MQCFGLDSRKVFRRGIAARRYSQSKGPVFLSAMAVPHRLPEPTRNARREYGFQCHYRYCHTIYPWRDSGAYFSLCGFHVLARAPVTNASSELADRGSSESASTTLRNNRVSVRQTH